MGFGPFDKAHLGVVGYASVAANGTVKASSGLTVTKDGTGAYHVDSLANPASSPLDPANQVPIFDQTDLALATAHVLGPFFASARIQSSSRVDVYCFVGPTGSNTDLDFSLTVLRPLAPQ